MGPMMRRRQIFTLVSTDHGTMIVPRTDYRMEDENSAVGVGCELMETGRYQLEEVETALGILELRQQYHGEGVLAIDGGANIGVHTIEWAKQMTHWGKVLALEPQDRIFYALAGNISLNNCFNAAALRGALTDKQGLIHMPAPDYSVASNFGGLSLISDNKDLGQPITEQTTVPGMTIDGFGFERVDFIKLDIEGMELMALEGAKETIEACHPVLMVEHIHVGYENLDEFFRARGYLTFRFGMNMIAGHRLDKVTEHIADLHHRLLRDILQKSVVEGGGNAS